MLTDTLILRANGKLLLTGEYFVLDGAPALAVPTFLGQRMEVSVAKEGQGRLRWCSYAQDGRLWFEGVFSLLEGRCLSGTDVGVAGMIEKILAALREQGCWAVDLGGDYAVDTWLEFPADWGFGSSSTLLYMLAQWQGADMWRLLAATFGGSGYDLACAGADGPIVFEGAGEGRTPSAVAVNYCPAFRDDLYLVHLNQKQNSREGIQRYRERMGGGALQPLLAEVGTLTQAWRDAASLAELAQVIVAHEALVSKSLGLPRVKDALFADYPGEVKSLGAWGGDFVLATGFDQSAAVRAYFAGRGYGTVLPMAGTLRLSAK